MNNTKHRRPGPLPIIDLAARYRVIIDTPTGPEWRTIGEGVDSAGKARQCAADHGFYGVWIFDGVGGRRYVVTRPRNETLREHERAT